VSSSDESQQWRLSARIQLRMQIWQLFCQPNKAAPSKESVISTHEYLFTLFYLRECIQGGKHGSTVGSPQHRVQQVHNCVCFLIIGRHVSRDELDDRIKTPLAELTVKHHEVRKSRML